MAEALKNNYNQAYIQRLSKTLKDVDPSFQVTSFKKFIFDSQWEQKELKQRMAHISEGLYQHLPYQYPKSLKLLLKAAPHFGSFEALFFPHFVESYGRSPKHRSLSLKALTLLTQYSSSEFAVRPFILEDPVKTMNWMTELSQHKNYHIRRLASEGCRPRLPWGQALPIFKKDPSSIIPILENLKNDSKLYVRKSVANNINDITKDNPHIVIKLVKKWLKEQPSEETLWIIQHGLRSLIKAGHPEALTALGYNSKVKVDLKNFSISKKTIALGESLSFRLNLHNKSHKAENLMIDYVIHHKKKNGETTEKVFKLTKKNMKKNDNIEIQKTHAFKIISTRKYYPGKHFIEIQVNGQRLKKIPFTLKA